MRNVVLITADSLRADHCSFMGYTRKTTPTLDEMARDGIVFTNAVSPGPSTPESMPVILTGDFPLESNEEQPSKLASRRQQIRRHMLVRDTMAEKFSRSGYATAAFSPNPYTSRYFGFDSGFDRFEDFMGGSRAKLYEGVLNGFLEDISLSSLLPARILLNWFQKEEVFKPWESFYEEIINWTNSVQEPYFLWILLMDTHDPYLTPTGYRSQSRRAMYHANWRLWRQGHSPPFSNKTHDRLIRAYDDSIRYADAFLKRLRRDLRTTDPLIAVHGDHGEAFGEHGTYGHHPRLYEENVHVPLVIDGMDAETIEAPVSLRRLVELLRTAALDEKVPEIPTSHARCRTLDGDSVAIRGADWKYHRSPDDEEFYDLTDGEVEPIDIPESFRSCRGLAEGWLHSWEEKALVRRKAARIEERSL